MTFIKKLLKSRRKNKLKINNNFKKNKTISEWRNKNGVYIRSYVASQGRAEDK